MTYTTQDIDVDGGRLRVGTWGDSGPLVLAVHGITSSHQAFALLGPNLGRDHRVVAPDLRGRGHSRHLPGPYGMAAHALDMAAVIAAAGGGPAIVVGHSMGGFVAVELARRSADLVQRLVLVDGGAPFAPPPGVTGADEAAIDAAIAATVGPAYARLSMTFPNREAYHRLWREHPSLAAGWNDAMAAYADYDIVGEEPELRPACRLEAALRDARDMYAFPGVEPAALPVPAVFLRAPRGMLDEPDKPLYPAGAATRWFPGVAESTVDDVNHYTITLGPAGAASVAAAVRGV